MGFEVDNELGVGVFWRSRLWIRDRRKFSWFGRWIGGGSVRRVFFYSWEVREIGEGELVFK